MESVITVVQNGSINKKTEPYKTDFYYNSLAGPTDFHGKDIPPLIWAIKYNNPRLVQLLLDIGADPNLKLNPIATYYIDYPLQYVTSKIAQQGVNLENIKIANMLIEAGAYINNYDDPGQIIGVFYNIKGVPTNNGELKEEYNKFENYVFSNLKLTPKQQGQKLHGYAQLNPVSHFGHGVIPIVRLLLKHRFDINAPIGVYVPAPPGKYIGTTRESTVYKEAKAGKYHPIINEMIIEFANKNREMAIRLGVNRGLPPGVSALIGSYLKPRGGGRRTRRCMTKRRRNHK